MVALAWVGAAEVSSLRGAVCARAECAQTTEDRQWRVVRGQSTEGRAAGSRHATRVRAARCALLNSVSSVPQCGQTGRGPFLIRSMPPPGPMGAATGNGDPRGSSAGRRPAARSPAGGSVIPAVPERLALRVANAWRARAGQRRGAGAGAVTGRDSGRRGGRSRSRVERSREGRWWSDARTVRSYSRGGQARTKTDTTVCERRTGSRTGSGRLVGRAPPGSRPRGPGQRVSTCGLSGAGGGGRRSL